jgi:hypothetical protein
VTIRNIEPQLKAAAESGRQHDRPGDRKIVNVPPGRAEDLLPWLRRSPPPSGCVVFASIRRPKHSDSQDPGAGAFEVVWIPLKARLYVVEIESAILGKALLDAPKRMCPRPCWSPTRPCTSSRGANPIVW